MPNGLALNEHLLSVSESFAALAASSARRMKLKRIAGLQKSAFDFTSTMKATNGRLVLIAFVTIWRDFRVQLRSCFSFCLIRQRPVSSCDAGLGLGPRRFCRSAGAYQRSRALFRLTDRQCVVLQIVQRFTTAGTSKAS